MAKDGYKVIVLEKQDILGGRYTTLNYKGYLITSGSIYIDNLRGSVIQVLSELGVESEVEVHMPHPFLKYRIDGKDYEIPEKGGIARLVSVFDKNAEEEERVRLAFRRALAWRVEQDEGWGIH